MVDFNFLTDCYDNDEDILTNQEKLQEIKYMLIIIAITTIIVLFSLNIYNYHSQLFKFTLWLSKELVPFIVLFGFILFIIMDTRAIFMTPLFLYLYFIIL
jgi:hypothetical protein